MNRLLASLVVLTCLVAAQSANAAGCLEGAALGGFGPHMPRHTFRALFSGCAGGMVVNHMYASWKRAHPNGTIREFVAHNEQHLPAGWVDRLSAVGHRLASSH